MQTFLPYPDFARSASVLDRQRLGKQRLEGQQIITALEMAEAGIKVRRRNHPAVLMWKGCIGCLAAYGEAVCLEWTRRGYVDNLKAFFAARRVSNLIQPLWLGDERLHSSHRARLLAKNPTWYGKFGWHEVPSEVNWWPVTKKET